jgi:hypothetical protein
LIFDILEIEFTVAPTASRRVVVATVGAGEHGITWAVEKR